MARTARNKAGTKAGAAKPVIEAETAAVGTQADPALVQDDTTRDDLPTHAIAETPDQDMADPEEGGAAVVEVPDLTGPVEPFTEPSPDFGEPAVAPVEEEHLGPVASESEAVLPEPDPAPEYVAEPIAERATESVAEPAAMPIPPVPPRPEPVATPVVQRNGVVPLVLGGVVAAGLGFGAAWYWFQTDSGGQADLIAAQAERIAALEASVAELPAMPDLAPLEAQVAAIGPDLTQAIDALDASVAAALVGFDGRLTALERAPSEDGTLAQTAIEAWERELDALRADVAAERDRMQQIADDADAQLAQTRVEATAMVDDATDTASAAVARAALSRVAAAIDAGTPFDTALAELSAEGVAVPDVLTAVAGDGVASLATLSAAFPPAARAALATARREGLAGEEGGGFSAFLRSQFDVRSVTPRDGAGPDAVLSRAEAALQANRLSDALAEVASLPEVARAEMSGWIADVDARLAALAAVQDLSQSLNQN